MMTVKIQTKYPDGSTHTLVRECDRVYYTEGWYSQLKEEGHTMQMGELINPDGSSAREEAFCVLVTIIQNEESSIVMCLPESWIYIMQDGKTVDYTKATFIPRN